MFALQKNKSDNNAYGSSRKNTHKPINDKAAFEKIASQFKIQPYPEPSGPMVDVELSHNEESHLWDYNPEPVQRSSAKEDEEHPVQGKMATQFAPEKKKEKEEMQSNAATQLSAEKEEGQVQAQSDPLHTNSTGMPNAVKAKMETAFNTDFSDVKVHANSEQSNQLGTLAYTQGSDVHFAAGQYNPSTQKGQELLGHELTHVVQQREGRVQVTKKLKESEVAINDSVALEREADEHGRQAANSIQIHSPIADNRLEVIIAQKKLQEIADNSLQVQQQRKLQENIPKGGNGGNHEASSSTVRILDGQNSMTSEASPIQMVKVRTIQDGSYKDIDTDRMDVTLEQLKSLSLVVHPEDREKLLQAILEKWKDRVRKISDAHTQVGPNAGKPAAYEEIELGPFRGGDPHEVSARPQMDLVSVAMGLRRDQEEALYRYSQGEKDRRDSPGYMDKNGWQSLKTAVDKIPSMGDMGRVATVFRADRTSDFTEFLMSRIGNPCYIEHGTSTTKAGVQHLASAAFTVNLHGMRDEGFKGKGMQLGLPKKLALTRIICRSARYIQYWGMHGASLDGGEVLIPAGQLPITMANPPIQNFLGVSNG